MLDCCFLKRKSLWLKILQALQAQKDAQGELEWHTACADGSVIRAQQHAAGASAASSATALSTLEKATPPIETPLLLSQVASFLTEPVKGAPSRNGFPDQ